MTDGKDAVPPTERDLFLEVMARPAASREKYLRERAGAWPKLVDQVLALLAHTSATECFVAAADAAMDGAAPRAPQSGGDETATDTVTGSQSTWQAFLEQLREVGCNFARYRHVGDVGRGGQGVILRVEDVVSRRPLAMKRIKRQETTQPGDETPGVDDETLGRFLDEAQIQAQLDHPSIVPVHEIGIDDRGRVYFTMKFVKGESLGKVFDKVRAGDEEWTVERALHSMVRVCEAMAYAHSKGVVHRDLKPGNVMVGRFGEVFVMDWGLARVLGEPDRRDIRVQPAVSQSRVEGERSRQAAETPDQALVTMDGAVLGTPFYMPPEQAAGRIEDVGRAADVYSAGAMLYHLLAGRAPYERPGARVSARTVLELVMQGAPESLTRLTKPPAALVAIVEKAMAREVKDRYPSMVELAKDLRAYLDGRVVQAFGTGVWQELKSFVRRNRAVAMVAVGSVVVAAGLVWAIVDRESERAAEAEGRVFAEQRLREDNKKSEIELRASLREVAAAGDKAKNASQELQKALETESDLRKAAEALAASKSRLDYWHQIQTISAAIDAGKMDVAKRHLGDLPMALRSFEWNHLNLKASPASTPKTLLGYSSGRADMPSDCSFMAYPYYRGIRTISNEGDVATCDVDFTDVDAVAVSGDGATLACSNGNEFAVVNRQGFAPKARWNREGPALGVRMSMDRAGRFLAYTTIPCMVVVREVASGAERCWQDSRGGDAHWSEIPIAISSDGKRTAFVDALGRARLWSLDVPGDPAPLDHWSSAVAVAFSADGRLLALGCRDGTIPVIDCSSLKLVALLRHDERPGNSHEVAFTPAGDRIVSSGTTKLEVLSLKHGGVEAEMVVGCPVTAVFSAADAVHMQNRGAYWNWPLEHTPGRSSLSQLSLWPAGSAFDFGGSLMAITCHNAAVMSAPPQHILVADYATGLPVCAYPGNIIAFSPDRHTAAIASSVTESSVMGVDSPVLPAGSIVIHDILGKSESRVIAEAPWGANSIAFSPDGSKLVAATGSVLTDDLVEVFGPSVMASPENTNRAGYSVEDNWIQMWDVHSRKLLAKVAPHTQLATAVAFHPSGSRIYSAGLDGRVCELAIQDLMLLRELCPPSTDAAVFAAVDPRGEFLIVGKRSGGVLWIDLARGESVRQSDEGGEVQGIAWSPDGLRLAVLGHERLVLFFREGDIAYEEHWKEGGGSLQFSMDGKRLMVGTTILETEAATAMRVSVNQVVARRVGHAAGTIVEHLEDHSAVREALGRSASIAPEHRAMAEILAGLVQVEPDNEVLRQMVAPGAAALASAEQRQRALAEMRKMDGHHSNFVAHDIMTALYIRTALGDIEGAQSTVARVRRHIEYLRPRVAKALLGRNDKPAPGGKLSHGHISVGVDPDAMVALLDISADLLEVQILLERDQMDLARAAYHEAVIKSDAILQGFSDHVRERLDSPIRRSRADIEAKIQGK